MKKDFRSFDDCYRYTYGILHSSPTRIKCRNLPLAYEINNHYFKIDCSNGISIFSGADSRAFPIKFALAEFMWILSGSNKLDEIQKWNAAMSQYSDDQKTLHGAYGKRILFQN